ncbi:LuxR C-terminal-related transcriptional regulator, partial [Streptomyces sp. NPDC054863]
ALDGGGRPGTAAELLAHLAEIELITGAPLAARDRADAVLADPTAPPEAALRALAVQVRADSRASRPDHARSAADALARQARQAPAQAAVHAQAVARLVRAGAHWHDGRPADAVGELRAAPGLGGGAPQPSAPHWDARAALATMLLDLGTPEHAGDVLRTGAGHAPPGCRAPLAALALERGEVDEAERLADEVLDEPDEDRARTDTVLALSVRAECALRRGRTRQARPTVARLLALLAEDRFGHATGRALRAVLRVTEADGGPQEALRLLHELAVAEHPAHTGRPGALPAASEGEPHAEDSAPTRLVPLSLLLSGPATPAWLVRLALDGGQRELAEAVAARTRAVDPESSATAHAEGVLKESAELLGRAAGGHGDTWARGRAEEDLGLLLLRNSEDKDGDDKSRARAVKRFLAALDSYDAFCSTPDAARMRSTLRGLGVRRRHWTYADRPATGWASLTDSERAVADLVAQGLTNRETADRMFLSPYTVNYHLRQIFRKLSLSSRVELAHSHRDHDRLTAAPAGPAPERVPAPSPVPSDGRRLRAATGAPGDRQPRGAAGAADRTSRSVPVVERRQ